MSRELANKPRKITVEWAGARYACFNCGEIGDAWSIKLNDVSFEKPDGTLGEKLYAKPMTVWLCEKCLHELSEAIDQAVEYEEVKRGER